jgi:hypothetical protein
LEEEFCNPKKGDMTITSYCQRLKQFFELLTNFDAPVSDQTLVLKTLNALHVIYAIQHPVPFSSFLQAKSMLLLKETSTFFFFIIYYSSS